MNLGKSFNNFHTSAITQTTFFYYLAYCCLKLYSIIKLFITTQTLRCFRIHWISKTNKAGNQYGFFILKIIGIKQILGVPSANKMLKFIVFCVREISSFKYVINKTRAGENEIQLKYSHHLHFFVLNWKIKNKFAWFLCCKRIHPNQGRQ